MRTLALAVTVIAIFAAAVGAQVRMPSQDDYPISMTADIEECGTEGFVHVVGTHNEQSMAKRYYAAVFAYYVDKTPKQDAPFFVVVTKDLESGDADAMVDYDRDGVADEADSLEAIAAKFDDDMCNIVDALK